MEFIGSYIQVL